MPNIAVELGKVSASLGVTTAYGEPQEVGGEQFVPVAATWTGFGGGSDDAGNGGGGGGGFSAPIGAYVRRDGQLRFEPNVIALLAVGVPFVCVAGRALTKLVRALKK
ncbi:hypothetical protein N8K70_07765 [Microbacterium betulae]|uniref:Sporulation protein n=1 Tax=Microbacterium betulae TaxID=2981139 RepID=A0AA97FLQ6_9MICO|nr:hypothetical protein [Microbacterium sp. AB]WOF24545.1 hypothetical protein N8K70_07765 [Microbacterium sp. AB]